MDERARHTPVEKGCDLRWPRPALGETAPTHFQQDRSTWMELVWPWKLSARVATPPGPTEGPPRAEDAIPTRCSSNNPFLSLPRRTNASWYIYLIDEDTSIGHLGISNLPSENGSCRDPPILLEQRNPTERVFSLHCSLIRVVLVENARRQVQVSRSPLYYSCFTRVVLKYYSAVYVCSFILSRFFFNEIHLRILNRISSDVAR